VLVTLREEAEARERSLQQALSEAEEQMQRQRRESSMALRLQAQQTQMQLRDRGEALSLQAEVRARTLKHGVHWMHVAWSSTPDLPTDPGVSSRFLQASLKRVALGTDGRRKGGPMSGGAQVGP